jgi:LPLT family lysophospholipid transporter-like MFS transporter
MKWFKHGTSLQKLYVSQFISAFVDNAFFFIILGFLTDQGVVNPVDSMIVPQTLFYVAYIVLAPFVGTFSEKMPKSLVLFIGNAIKAIGIALLFFGVPPAWCYMIVGIGAVVYSPAKYGILLELTTTSKQLLTANGKLEGYTIMAIIFGTVVGGYMAQLPGIALELGLCIAMYAVSITIAASIPRGPTTASLRYIGSALLFGKDIAILLRSPITRFTLIGTAGFWMISAMLRLAFIEWLMVHIPTLSESQRPLIFGVTVIGIIIGALLVPKFYEIRTFYRSTPMGMLLVLVIIGSVFSPNLFVLVPFLLMIGVLGGLYIVPMNAALQKLGSPMVGSGKVVAIQNVFENIFMLIGIGFLGLKTSGALSLSINAVIIIGAIALGAIIVYLYSLMRRVKDEAQRSLM